MQPFVILSFIEGEVAIEINVPDESDKIVLRSEQFLEEYYGKPLSEILTLETEDIDFGPTVGDEVW